MKYSFVIPVYKSEKYLDKCIASILNQSFSDYEIWLIDDGSPDHAGEICDRYSEDYSFIHTVHQENRGASAARNCGIEHAEGKYIIFLDSDDFWTDDNGLEKIDRKTADDPDLVVFASKDYREKTGVYSDDRYYYDESINACSPLEILQYMIRNDRYNVSPGKRAIKRTFLIDNNLYFKVGIRCEDIDLGIRISNALPAYRFLNEKIYVYRHHEGSVTSTIGEQHLKEYLSIIREYGDKTYPYANEEVKSLLLSYLGYQLALLMAYTAKLKPGSSDELLKEMKRYTYLFKYTSYPRTKKIYSIYRILGFRLTCQLLGAYLGNRKW